MEEADGLSANLSGDIRSQRLDTLSAYSIIASIQNY